MSLYIGDTLIAGSFKSGASWEVGDVGISAFGIDEALNKRRYLNGQVISQAQFVEFTAMLKSRVSVYPSLATTEVNWQAAVTNSDLGQCGQFVIDDDAGTIRLPKVVNIQGLFDLTGLGTTIEAGLPNITGNIGVGGSVVTSQSGAFYKTRNTFMWSSNTATEPNCLSFDASLSNSIYGNSTTVQPESIQYPYFIQVAEGIENSVDVSREIELNNPFSLLDYKYSEYELSNASWLLSNGQFNSGATYPAVYDLLLQIYNGTVTKAGVSVKLSTETYADTDFVLNTTDTTFRLPIKVLLAGSKRVAGNGMTLGLYNGTDNVGLCRNIDSGITNLNTCTQYGSQVGTASSTTGTLSVTYGITTDPTKSGIEVKDDSSIYLYFYVGETVQDASVIAASAALTTISNLTPCHVVVERYINGTSGYDLYDDGMCRQWGILNGANTSISFLKEFVDTGYIFICFASDNNTLHTSSSNRTTTGIEVRLCQYGTSPTTSSSYNHNWEAYGKLADGEY